MAAIRITGGVSTGKTTLVECLREICPDAKFFTQTKRRGNLSILTRK